MENTPPPTRGNGLFEGFLSRQRAKIADKLIPESSRNGRILDIGCGPFPYFLSQTRFAEKYGVDLLADGKKELTVQGARILHFDVETDIHLPFESSHFDAVTMLAVFEHIEPNRLPDLLMEIHRVLKDDGAFILTTPASWADKLLRFLAKVNLVSAEEIDEHKAAYTHGSIKPLLEAAGFAPSKIRAGYFELMMNLWVAAVK